MFNLVNLMFYQSKAAAPFIRSRYISSYISTATVTLAPQPHKRSHMTAIVLIRFISVTIHYRNVIAMVTQTHKRRHGLINLFLFACDSLTSECALYAGFVVATFHCEYCQRPACSKSPQGKTRS